MTFNLVHLKYFYDAIRLESITASARENHVTQSAVSQGIMKLEQHFQRKLLTHKRNLIKLTPEGKALFASSKQLFYYIDDVNNTFADGNSVYKGKVEFACFYSIAVSFLPNALAEFQKHAPSISAKFITGRPEIVKNALKEGRVEFGLMTDGQDLLAYDCELIHSGFFHVYESIKRPAKTPITQCILSEHSVEANALKKTFEKNYGKELFTHMDVGSWEVIVNLVLSNVGVGLVPDYLVEVPYRKDLLRLSHIKHDPIPYRIVAASPKGEELSKNAKLLINCLKMRVLNIQDK
ncbi:MAG: LysR family transcriptional regulator [Chlamydiales bacterium]|nr:LysR family transcriptional regulator [Chlamydiales bacterium]